MSNSGLTILVGELLGVPTITLSGTLEERQEQAVLGVLNSYRDQGVPSLVLDMAGLGSMGVDNVALVLKALRSVGPGLCVHVVATGAMCAILNRAGLGQGVRTYSSLDEISESFTPHEEYMTSRWMASGIEDFEQPLAA